MTTTDIRRSTDGHPSLSPAQGIWLVAERELSTRLRSKAFLISTGILLLVALAGVIWMGIASNSTSSTPIAATSEAAAMLPDGHTFEVTEIDGREAATALVEDGEVDAAVIADSSAPTGVVIIANQSPPDALVAAFSLAPTVELLDPDAPSFGMRYALGMIFGIVFMMAALSFGSPIATSVVEEKQTRIIEILLSAIPARVLLAGKVIGNTLLAITQILLLVVAAAVGLIVTGQTELLQGFGAPLIWFAVFFLFGFVLIATMFAAAGSLVSRQEDVGSVYTPMMLLVMAPFYLVLFLGENQTVMTILSYVPFSAPVAMPIRLFFGEAAWWEPLVALALLVATCAVVTLLSAKIYENSLLKMGARVKLGEALRV
ncbi:ABC transporter permease [Microbacterium sp. CIAB417]|uniref:ABC transporter permease n=1 Tax=Microbacterium sp. CIAB417 TaxID=2860287 RepID=UPI001FABAEE5|nr:ABC transporter permease [Microbacterium sp. CIAB417]